MQNTDIQAQQAMGLLRYDTERKGLPKAERQVLENANAILGFS